MTHVTCAFDHVIEPFRNDLFPGNKTGAGVDADLLARLPLAERALSAPGIADLEWRGAGADLEEVCRAAGDEDLPKRVTGRLDLWRA